MYPLQTSTLTPNTNFPERGGQVGCISGYIANPNTTTAASVLIYGINNTGKITRTINPNGYLVFRSLEFERIMNVSDFDLEIVYSQNNDFLLEESQALVGVNNEVNVNISGQLNNINVNITGQTNNINVNLAAQSGNINVNLAAQTGNIDVNIATQSANINVNLAAQTGNINVNLAAQTSNININIAAQSSNINVALAATSVTLDVNLSSQSTNINVALAASTITLDVNLSGQTNNINVNLAAQSANIDVNLAAQNANINIAIASSINLPRGWTLGSSDNPILSHGSPEVTANINGGSATPPAGIKWTLLAAYIFVSSNGASPCQAALTIARGNNVVASQLGYELLAYVNASSPTSGELFYGVGSVSAGSGLTFGHNITALQWSERPIVYPGDYLYGTGGNLGTSPNMIVLYTASNI